MQADCSAAELERAARTSVAMDRARRASTTSARSPITTWASAIRANEDAISSIILGNSLLTARGIPVAGEFEIKNVQAMKILDSFGVGGSFTEYYAMDYHDDVVLMGHDGPGHIAIAEGKTKVRPLEVYHGKVGRGLSVEMSVKHGPVTLLSVVQTVDGQLMLLVAEAESVAGPDPRDRQHQQPLPFPRSAVAISSKPGTPTAPPTIARSAWDTSPLRSRSSVRFSACESSRSASWYNSRRLSRLSRDPTMRRQMPCDDHRS